MRRVEVLLPGHPYQVLIGPGTITELPSHLWGRSVAVVDAAVSFESDLPVLRLEGGETAKTLAGAGRIIDFLEREGVGRDGTVVAVGGGTVGDVAGFAASIWQRGVALINVPTTLLAMVDSSIGGKTGVNTVAAKNAVGTFWQPRAVIADLDFLQTLPPSQVEAGQAEVVKYAMTLDPGLAEITDLEEVVARSAAAKAGVIAGDERDHGLREILNYGHTVGHAIETASGYAVHHGRAVAVGMRVAARISVRMGLCDPALIGHQDRLLAAHGLPGDLPRLDPATVIAGLVRDKKARLGRLRWVLLRGIGQAEPGHDVPDAVVREALEGILNA